MKKKNLTEFRTTLEVAESIADKFWSLTRGVYASDKTWFSIVELAYLIFGFNCKPYPFAEAAKKHKFKYAALDVDSRTIYYQMGLPKNQFRFAISHELGHLVLHEGGLSKIIPEYDDFVTIMRQSLRSTKTKKEEIKYKYQELEADRFAAALLIPQTKLNRMIQRFKFIDAFAITKIAEEFSVSLKAVILRIEELDNHLFWTGPPLDTESIRQLKYILNNHWNRVRKENLSKELYPPHKLKNEAISPDFYLLRKFKPLPKQKEEPLVIEFAGMPNTGKDTQIAILKDYLEKVHSFRVRVIEETFRLSYIRGITGSYEETLRHCSTIVPELLHRVRYENPGGYDIVIFNRGVMDTIAVLCAANKEGHLSKPELQARTKFLSLYMNYQDAVFLLTTTPEESVKREVSSVKSFLLELPGHGGFLQESRVHTEGFLMLQEESYQEAYKIYKQKFDRIYQIGKDGDRSSNIGEIAQEINKYLFMNEKITNLKRKRSSKKNVHQLSLFD